MNEKTGQPIRHTKLLYMVECALFAAILCIFSPIQIPIGPIPIAMSVFAVMFTGVCLGWKTGAAAVIVYIFIGICGMPLFAGGTSGLPALAGLTGGYIWSYIFMVIIIGLFCRIPSKKYITSVIIAVAGCLLGLIVCYICGTAQYMLLSGCGLLESLAVCVFPFIPFDILKAVCASLLGVSLKTALRRCGISLPE